MEDQSERRVPRYDALSLKCINELTQANIGHSAWAVGVTLAIFEFKSLQEVAEYYDGYFDEEELANVLDELRGIGSEAVNSSIPD